MSMLEHFFSLEGDHSIFDGLEITKDTKLCEEYMGKYPVIFVSLKGINAAAYKDAFEFAVQIIKRVAGNFQFLLESESLSDYDKSEYRELLDSGMSEAVFCGGLKTLSALLEKHCGEKVILLIDEYDVPLSKAFENGYYDQMVFLIRNLLEQALKTNNSLKFAVMTGCMRISKESIFTGMNNLKVITTTSDKYATAFGFTEKEVFNALDDMELGSEKGNVKKWYDGFTFGSHTDIYNPWSICSFIENNGKYENYWADTSSNGLVNSLMQTGVPGIKQTMEALLQGKSFEAELDEKIVFDQLDGSVSAVWSLLLATGYLKVLDLKYVGEHKRKVYTLTLTNMEADSIFENMVKGWFGGSTETYYNEFINALLHDNVRKMNTFMNKVALNTFSSFDSGNKPSEQTEPERFYHGFVLGMVVNMADMYIVRSNRESGYGRYDVMLEPVDKNGKAFIFEFKVLDPDEDEETLEDTLAAAHRQIAEKKYETELVSRGFAPEKIRKYGFAFRGRECLIG